MSANCFELLFLSEDERLTKRVGYGFKEHWHALFDAWARVGKTGLVHKIEKKENGKWYVTPTDREVDAVTPAIN